VGVIVAVVWLLEIAKGWDQGYDGMFGRGYSVAIVLIFSLGGGALFGALAGMFAAGGVLLGQAISRRWLVSAIGASIGAAAIAVLVLVILQSDLSLSFAVAILLPAMVGPFAYVAWCSRRLARSPQPV